MAPNRETPIGSYNLAASINRHADTSNNSRPKPPMLSLDSLHRTISDISDDLAIKLESEVLVEVAKCECCGMSEECTPEYIGWVRREFLGRFICGMCSAAVRERLEKGGSRSREEALDEHVRACVRFNRVGRAFPVLSQAEAMKEILKKRANSMSPKGVGPGPKKLGGCSLMRSSSCIPTIAGDGVGSPKGTG